MSILREILQEQPEGSRHSVLVNRSLKKAIDIMVQHISVEDWPFSLLQKDYDKRERNILRVASWLHGVPISGFRKLKNSPLWKKIYTNSNKHDRRELFFILYNYMDCLGKHFQDCWISEEGKYDPALRLLLTFMVMDRLGRSIAALPCGKMIVVAIERKRRAKKQHEPNTPSEFVKYLIDKGLNSMVIAAILRGKRDKGLPNFSNLSDLEIGELVL